MSASAAFDTCVYHGGCPDGFGGAYSVWKRLGDQVRFIPGISGAPVDVAAFTDRSVVMVDFCWDRETVTAVARAARRLLILDHHRTAADALEGLEVPGLQPVFDMDKSGARMAWEWFHPEGAVPELIQHIEDYDLFRFALPGTDEISLALASHPMDFTLWDTLEVGRLRQEGAGIARWMGIQVERIARSSRRMMVDGYDVPSANAPRCFVDRLGHRLAQGEPFAVVWAEAGGRIHFSLRSQEDGMPVNALAERHGGRGHRHAAVFSLPIGSPEAACLLGSSQSA